jgi:hypothetical protein
VHTNAYPPGSVAKPPFPANEMTFPTAFSISCWPGAARARVSSPGATPKVVVLDNLREGVLKPDWYDPTLNSLYRDVLDHHSVIALPCRPYHPNRKGKVESSVGHAHTGRPGALPPGLLFRLGCEGPPTPIASPSQLGASGRPDLSQQTPAGSRRDHARRQGEYRARRHAEAPNVTHQLRPPDGPPLFPSPQVGQADMTTPALATTGLEVRIHVLALDDHRTERNGDTSAIVGRAAASLPAGTTARLPALSARPGAVPGSPGGLVWPTLDRCSRCGCPGRRPHPERWARLLGGLDAEAIRVE